MAEIPRAAIDYVTREINGASAQAQEQVMRVLERIDWSDVTLARELVVEAVQMALSNATTLAAQASADFYDASRELSVGDPLGARAISDYDPAKTDGAIRSFVRFVLDGRTKTFNDQVLQRIDYEVKRSANMCMVENGRLDSAKPKFARVPNGSETCDFCLMLASRGFVYRSESTASASHVHSDCDCRIVPGWDGDEVEGYDPYALYGEWQGNLNAKAKDRAERNGTSESEELAKIMRAYGESAKRAKERNKRA